MSDSYWSEQVWFLSSLPNFCFPPGKGGLTKTGSWTSTGPFPIGGRLPGCGLLLLCARDSRLLFNAANQVQQ